jgi:cell division protein FtsQ
MKKLKWSKLFRLLGLLVFLTVLIVSSVYSTIERKKARCNKLIVQFTDDHQYVSAKKIESIIRNNLPDMKGCLLDTLETDWIEEEIEKLSWVKKADIFKSYGFGDDGFAGVMKVKITQHTPMFRVQHGETGYYVGVEKNRLPLSTLHTPRVLVVTGNVDKKLIEGELYTFIQYVKNDRFWNAQLEQVHVTRHKDLVLVPRIGSHLIEFGPPVDMEIKFRNLEAIYKHGFDEESWRKYKYVSLKYNNQVICTLK